MIFVTIDRVFAHNLARIRKQKGLSQADLAMKSGISARMIGHYETHASDPPIQKIQVLANALDVDMADLLGIGERKANLIEKDFNVKTLKRFRDIIRLNKHDRAAVYKMVDALLQKNEYH